MQAKAIQRLIDRFGKVALEWEYRTGTAYLRTADAIEYAINRRGDVRVNYVHPYRRPPSRIAGLLTA